MASDDDADYRQQNIQMIYAALEQLERLTFHDPGARQAVRDLIHFCTFAICLMDCSTVEQVEQATQMTVDKFRTAYFPTRNKSN
jgi:hypothetical protein